MLKTIRKAITRIFKRGNVEEMAAEVAPAYEPQFATVHGKQYLVLGRIRSNTYNHDIAIRKLKSQRKNWKYWRAKK